MLLSVSIARSVVVITPLRLVYSSSRGGVRSVSPSHPVGSVPHRQFHRFDQEENHSEDQVTRSCLHWWGQWPVSGQPPHRTRCELATGRLSTTPVIEAIHVSEASYRQSTRGGAGQQRNGGFEVLPSAELLLRTLDRVARRLRPPGSAHRLLNAGSPSRARADP
jgi:hypothetical protein